MREKSSDYISVSSPIPVGAPEVMDETASNPAAVVCAVVAAALGHSTVGPDDNMLELGVDSLVGTRIVVDLRGQLGVNVLLLHLFENPLVGDFAALVSELVCESGE